MKNSREKEIEKILHELLECSLFVGPIEMGLSRPEMIEAGHRVGYATGEWQDALSAINHYFDGASKRYLPQKGGNLDALWMGRNPDWRNPDAFNFVHQTFDKIGREHGRDNTRISRDVLMTRAEAAGVGARDVEGALAVLLLEQLIVEKEQVLGPQPKYFQQAPPYTQMQNRTDVFPPSPARARMRSLVEDLINRRQERRPIEVDALDAFGEALKKLGFGSFTAWWRQTRAELRQTDPMTSPISAAVLSAALVEGALTFLVKAAKDSGLNAFKSTDFDRPLTSWRIEQLVTTAMHGGADAVLDSQVGGYAQDLVRLRQRIHAGRILLENPKGVADLLPEEAKVAKMAAERVVRSILVWMERHPIGRPQ